MQLEQGFEEMMGQFGEAVAEISRLAKIKASDRRYQGSANYGR